MSKNIEIEFKNMVTEAEFQFLLRSFNVSSHDFFTQTNHYFDTNDFLLKEKGAALRIRELPVQYELTLKKPAQNGLLEINQLLSAEEVDAVRQNISFPAGEIKDEIQKMGITVNQLLYFGSLTTKRAEISDQNGLLVFDHSFYLDQEDYEIEYEVTDWEKGKAAFEMLLERLNIERKTADNKVRRFYEAKKRLQNMIE